MLLSDRDLKAALAEGRMGLSPYDEAMVQPSSVDVRLDRYFRVFANHRYTHIDPAVAQDDLTELLEPEGEEPFILHPGEFVLGSTLEVISLGNDLAARLEGKALALDTEVPTPWGWTTMEHLEVGDEVFDETGAPTTVIAATDEMLDRPCHEVLLSDGSRFIADAQHLWVTRTKAERLRGRAGTSRTTEEIAAGLRAGRDWNHHIVRPELRVDIQPLSRSTPLAPAVGPALIPGGWGADQGGLALAPMPVAVHLPAASRAIVGVRPIASVPVRCIQVAATSGMFLVGRTFVPTHNSSLGRLGLLTHSTAGFIDPGFSGHVTLELSNVANLPIKLYPGMKIGQICVLPLTSPAEHPYGSSIYGSRYQDQRGPTPSRSHLRFSRTPTQ
jgi:deoxycytidine triphosphate deaminase